jgi:glucose-1-phosphate adenylyltransferase
MKDIHALIFTNQANYDLKELTEVRSMSSVPYGGRFRMIDFMLSNCVNCGITDIGVVLQQNYQSLLDHIGSGKHWDLARRRGGLRLLPPFSLNNNSRMEFRGRMDALAGLGSYVAQVRQDYILLTDGDIALNINLSKVLDQHLASGADITVVCTPKHIGDPKQTTYILPGEDGTIADIIEKPDEEAAGYEYISMALLSTKLLTELIKECASHGKYSFSKDVLVGMKDKLDIRAYVFNGYVARFTSVASYYAQSMDLLDHDVRKELFNPDAPIRSKDRTDAPTYYAPGATAANSLISDGCVIEGTVQNSILFRNVRVAKGAVVKNSILMKGTVVGEGASVNCTIADKNVTVSPGSNLSGHPSYPLLIAKDSQV